MRFPQFNGRHGRPPYDVLGRLIRWRDAVGTVFRWTYNAAGQLIEETSSQGTLRYAYDALGNMLSRSDLAGQRTRFSYDPRGLLTEIRYPDETVQFAYDIMRRMTESSNPALTERYTYDPLGRLVEVDNVTLRKQVQYTYDARGLRTSLRDPEGRQSRYEYDALGRLTEFLDPQGGRTRYTFDPLSRKTEIKYANDTITRHTYDAGSRLTGIHAQGPKGDIVRYGYTYDPVGNPLESAEGSTFGRTSRAFCRRVKVMAPLVTGAALRVKTTHRVKATVLLVGTDRPDTAEALPGKDKVRAIHHRPRSGPNRIAAPRIHTTVSATGSPSPSISNARRIRTKG